MAEKIEPKILLMDKAVVTLLIRSFFDNGGLFANYTYILSCYILLLNSPKALENTGFIAGELSLIVSLVLYRPTSVYELGYSS